LDNSLAPSTVKTYQQGLKLFGYFRKEFGLKDIWLVPLQEIIFYISHLFNSGRSYSTVSCYLAVLSVHNKVYNFEDNTHKLIHNHWLSIIHYDCQSLAQHNSPWCTSIGTEYHTMIHSHWLSIADHVSEALAPYNTQCFTTTGSA
jgi:hypothetical protein